MAKIQKRADGQTIATVSFTGRMAKLISGELDVRDLDDVELARGQCRDEHGRFRGGAPDAVPKQIHDERVRRLFERADEMFQSSFLEAASVFREIMNDPNNTPADRMKAAQFIIERVAGRTPDRVTLHVEDKVEKLFREMFQLEDGLEDEIVDAEVVEEPVPVG